MLTIKFGVSSCQDTSFKPEVRSEDGRVMIEELVSPISRSGRSFLDLSSAPLACD